MMPETPAARAYPRGFGLLVAAAVGAGIFGAVRCAAGEFTTGLAALLVSVLALRWPYSIWAAPVGAELSWRARVLGVLGLCVVAIFFRFYRMEPPGLWGDDAINGLLALDVLEGKIPSPLTLVNHAYSSFHALTNFTIAASFALFGVELWSLRLPGVIANLAAVPVLYGIVSPLFGARTALLAALFFASSPFQLGHAKGMPQNEFGLFFEMLGLCLIVRGTLGTRPWLITAAAVPVALALYTYHSAKLVPLIAVAVLLNTYWMRAPGRPALRVHIVAAVALFVLCVIPAAVGYITDPNALLGRIGSTGIWAGPGSNDSWWPLWNALWRTLLIFHYQQGPQYHWFGIGTDPGFTAVAACLLAHGLVESLRRRREPQHRLLLQWVLIGCIPALFSVDAPRGYRLLIATPPLYTWAAMLPAQLFAIRQRNATLRRSLQAVAVAVTLAVPLIDFNYYFYRVYSSGLFHWYQADHMVTMARALRALGPKWTGYVLSDTFDANYETLRFLARAWNLSLETVGSYADVLPLRDGPDRDGGALFMFARGPLESSAELRDLYPDVSVDVRYEPTPQAWWFERWFPLAQQPPKLLPVVGLVEVTGAEAATQRGITVRFKAADGTQVGQRVDDIPRLRGTSDLPPVAQSPVRAQWIGSLFAPRSGQYRFVLQTSGETAVWLDEMFLVGTDRPEATRQLAAGLHTITIDTTIADPPLLALQWQPPEELLATVPPAAFFRVHPVHGLTVTYEAGGRTWEVIEPLPYHFFFPERIPGIYSVGWRGRLEVPAPGGHLLRPDSNRPIEVRIDGQPWTPQQQLAAGSHTIEISQRDVVGSPRLRLYWQPPGADRELIPPAAFAPRS